MNKLLIKKRGFGGPGILGQTAPDPEIAFFEEALNSRIMVLGPGILGQIAPDPELTFFEEALN